MRDRSATAHDQTAAKVCRCLFPECPAAANCARCDEAGVLGPVPGTIGTLQALEAIKVVTGVGDPLAGRLLLFDALAARFSTVKLRPARQGCAACNGGDAAASLQRRGGGVAAYDYASFTGTASSRSFKALCSSKSRPFELCAGARSSFTLNRLKFAYLR